MERKTKEMREKFKIEDEEMKTKKVVSRPQKK